MISLPFRMSEQHMWMKKWSHFDLKGENPILYSRIPTAEPDKSPSNERGYALDSSTYVNVAGQIRAGLNSPDGDEMNLAASFHSSDKTQHPETICDGCFKAFFFSFFKNTATTGTFTATACWRY